MSGLIGRLVAHGGAPLIEQSQSLIAQLDRGGQLIEWNTSVQHILDSTPGAVSVPELLDASSRTRFMHLIEQALAQQLTGPIMLNFNAGSAALPHSYSVRLIALPDAQLILLAEPLAPLDTQSAQEYMRITNELATTTRNLQKARYELTKKQQQLEQALNQLEQLARIDELTQVLNRRSIMGYLHEEIERSTRYPAHVSILLIDIDFFKQINDRYGHQTGDEVLRSTAGLLQQSIRATDHLGRYGGEEFLCILPMTEPDAAAELAERLGQRISSAHYAVADTVNFYVTISSGVAGFDWQTDTISTLIAHADDALYQAKARGRNQHCIWQP